jgi:putative two-component system response regulator
MTEPNRHADPIAANRHSADVMLLAMATLLEQRDTQTHQHLLRVRAYVTVLAQALQSNPRWQDLLTPAYISHLLGSVWVYDMGTLSVPERVLLKPGVYTSDERRAMQAHTVRGFAALQQAEKTMAHSDEAIQVAKEVTLSHHEHWDGQGYPQGLQGKSIPASARIIAVADAYDAMVGIKVYKPTLSHEQALAQLWNARGVQFDPDVVDAFINQAHAIGLIAQRLADTEQDLQRKMQFMDEAVAAPPER